MTQIIPQVSNPSHINGQLGVDYLAKAQETIITPAQLQAEKAQTEADAALLNAGAHDEGNAQCVYLRHRGRFLYNDAYGWVHNAGTHWTDDGAEAALDRSVVETLHARIAAVGASGKAEQYAGVLKKAMPDAGRVAGAKTLLSSLVYASPSSFDTNPDLLNCPNGVVDLRTGELHPHAIEDRFMHCSQVGYNPGADQSTWVDWLSSTVGADVADWLQIAVGYTLTGYTREEILFYLFGPPRAGKGLFTETIAAMLGEPLAKEVNFSTFTAQRTGDSQNFDLAPLKPCRMVAASESNSYERFNEAKVKALTGGNEVYCAFKHRTHFSYRPTFKIWLSSNQPVNADPDDDAVWGRLRVIGFSKSHLGSEDKTLKERFKSASVLEGVLAWAVAGAVRWYRLGATGLPEIESSRRLKDAHRGELDNIKIWLEERCLIGGNGFTPHQALYLSYEKWCHENGVEPKKQKGFTQSLERKGYQSDRSRTADGKQARGFRGIAIG
jgi:putative DNA primase/helicase